MSKEIKNRSDRIENALEYIGYAKENLKGDFSDICDELSWIYDTLEGELINDMKKRESHDI